tara:strand:+ start:4001 stop:4273 length:273 start_codon:yes stop_codon:yes gene_type:complete
MFEYGIFLGTGCSVTPLVFDSLAQEINKQMDINTKILSLSIFTLFLLRQAFKMISESLSRFKKMRNYVDPPGFGAPFSHPLGPQVQVVAF